MILTTTAINIIPISYYTTQLLYSLGADTYTYAHIPQTYIHIPHTYMHTDTYTPHTYIHTNTHTKFPDKSNLRNQVLLI